jgi:hypothetical protein
MAHSSVVDREMNVSHCVARIQGSRLFASYRSSFLEIDKRKRDKRDECEYDIKRIEDPVTRQLQQTRYK